MGSSQSNSEIKEQYDPNGKTDYISSSESINTLREQNQIDSNRSEANYISSSSEVSTSKRSHDKSNTNQSQHHKRRMPFEFVIGEIKPKRKNDIENKTEENIKEETKENIEEDIEENTNQWVYPYYVF